MKFTRLSLLALAFLCAAVQAAPPYPNKPIRVIVPFGAGTGVDLAVRLATAQIGADTGANLVVENVPGANTLIGIRRALAAPSDGYTLVATGSTPNSIAPSLYKQATYDPIKDFSHIAVLAVYPATLLVVSADSAYKDLQSLVSATKARPGQLTLGHSSPAMQIKSAAFTVGTKINIVPVPYKTSTEAMQNLVGGQLDAMVVDFAVAMPLIRQGRVRPISVLSTTRSRLLPDVPNIDEAGYAKMALVSWVGIGAPGQIPTEAKAWLLKSFNHALANPQVQEKYLSLGAESISDLQIDQFLEVQLTAWRKGVQDAGLKAE